MRLNIGPLRNLFGTRPPLAAPTPSIVVTAPGKSDNPAPEELREASHALSNEAASLVHTASIMKRRSDAFAALAERLRQGKVSDNEVRQILA